MGRSRQWLAGLLLGTALLPAQAGGMYRCGNTISDKPCPDGRELKHYSSGTVQQDGSSPRERGSQLCRAGMLGQTSGDKAEDVHIRHVSGGQSDIIDYGAGRLTTARAFLLEVQTRNAFGNLQRPDLYRCHTSDDGRRVLRYERLGAAPGGLQDSP